MKPQQVKWYGWKPDKPDHRDKAHEFKPTAIRLPPHAALDGLYVPPVRNQNNLGACTGYSSTSAMSFTMVRAGQPFVWLSPMFAYFNGRTLEGTVNEDSGCEIRDVLKQLHKIGCCPEIDYPYSDKDTGKATDPFRVKPSEAAYKAASKDRIVEYRKLNDTKLRLRSVKEAIVRQQPVVFGFSVYENFDAATKSGIMPMPKGEIEGGHAIWAVAYDDDKKVVKIQNSWDTDWGDKGYFYMPYDYISELELADDFWALKVIS